MSFCERIASNVEKFVIFECFGAKPTGILKYCLFCNLGFTYVCVCNTQHNRQNKKQFVSTAKEKKEHSEIS